MAHSLEMPIRVLICEDNMVSRLIAEAACARLGCDVVAFDSVTAALQHVEAEGNDAPLDLILTDMHLVEESGLDLIRGVRALGWSGFRLPIAIMTAQPSAADEMACHQAGGQFVLSKPVSETVLRDLIERSRPIQWRSEGERIFEDMQLVHRYQAALLATRDALKQPPDLLLASKEARARLIVLLHELAGVGSMFGTPLLATQANALESALRAGMPEGASGLVPLQEEILGLLNISLLPGSGDGQALEDDQ